MSKELEEILIVGLIAIVFLKSLGSNGAASTALAQSKIDSATNLGYAADVTTIAGDFFGGV